MKTWKRNTGPANQARRGKRINDPGPGWPNCRRRLASAVAKPIPEFRSQRQAAAYVGVDVRSVGRWLQGKHWPSSRSAQRLCRWLAMVEKEKAQ